MLGANTVKWRMIIMPAARLKSHPPKMVNADLALSTFQAVLRQWLTVALVRTAATRIPKFVRILQKAFVAFVPRATKVTTTNESSAASTPSVALIGGIAGGVLFVIAIAVSLFCCCGAKARKSRRSGDSNKKNPNPSQSSAASEASRTKASRDPPAFSPFINIDPSYEVTAKDQCRSVVRGDHNQVPILTADAVLVVPDDPERNV